VVTGASTGIGRGCAGALAAIGTHVWASVRAGTGGQALRRGHRDAVTVLRVEVTGAGSVAW